jgi:AAA+ ATPase superfamily predicted ATPase
MKRTMYSRTTRIIAAVICVIVTVCCQSNGQQRKIIDQKWELIASIPTPNEYNRISYDSTSFSSWIRQLPLAGEKTIRMYSGEIVNRSFYNVTGVVQLPILFKEDLEQCADYAMRIWAEYHKQNNKLDKLYLFDYSGN